MTEGVALVVRRTIRATPERLFAAWTEPEHLCSWWGPRPVTCAGAEVDLRVGGRYRIVNALPGGTTVTIEGQFREIEPPPSSSTPGAPIRASRSGRWSPSASSCAVTRRR